MLTSANSPDSGAGASTRRLLGPTPPPHQQITTDPGHRHAADDQPADPAPPPPPDDAGPPAAQPVGQPDRGARPVVRAEAGLDVLVRDRVGGLLAQREVLRVRDVVRPVLRGHGEQHVVAPELGELARAVGPLLWLGPVERAHVDDEEVVPLLRPQPVDRLLDAGLRGRVEHARPVGDPVGQPERRISDRHPGTGEQEERDNHTQSDETRTAPIVPRSSGLRARRHARCGDTN